MITESSIYSIHKYGINILILFDVEGEISFILCIYMFINLSVFLLSTMSWIYANAN